MIILEEIKNNKKNNENKDEIWIERDEDGKKVLHHIINLSTGRRVHIESHFIGDKSFEEIFGEYVRNVIIPRINSTRY
ncbi:hypothetical protein [Tissierella sp.]|uniref:hypothetical protein n=1 Tax=Tissierella sp. TaxID=41274 RepID=UPI0030586C22